MTQVNAVFECALLVRQVRQWLQHRYGKFLMATLPLVLQLLVEGMRLLAYKRSMLSRSSSRNSHVDTMADGSDCSWA